MNDTHESNTIEYLRIPDLDRIFGIKRGHAYSLIKEGKIKTACLRLRDGNKTGVRLVDAQSVREYIKSNLE